MEAALKDRDKPGGRLGESQTRVRRRWLAWKFVREAVRLGAKELVIVSGFVA